MSITFLQLAERVLNEVERPLSVEEIWQTAIDSRLVEQLNSNGKTPMATLGAQLHVALRNDGKWGFAAQGSRPKKFYLKRREGELNFSRIDDVPPIEKTHQRSFLEKDLHPLIVYYANLHLQAFCKTINHTKSGRAAFGEWIHPDIVACYFPIGEWDPAALEFSHALGAVNLKLFSFELKRTLSFANLREAFFQAVSNSSWANEGYLCAAEISVDEEFQSELKRLSGSFGIGIIKLDIDEPDSTEVIYPARLQESLDWESINKLCANPDFKDFIQRVKNDLSSREVRNEWYDKILSSDQLRKLARG